jgi:hypothetical protein
VQYPLHDLRALTRIGALEDILERLQLCQCEIPQIDVRANVEWRSITIADQICRACYTQ